MSATLEQNSKFTFSATRIESSKVDKVNGVIRDVSIISFGPAVGHGSFVDQTSLQTVLTALGDDRLPAYITHRGAIFDDRLTNEIGYFDNFREDETQIRADFHTFESFREDESAKFNRLFELAETMPNRFGLSIVFYATLAWATTEGDMDFDYEADRPVEAIYADPSIRVTEVESADFVDKPAANATGLFRQQQIDNKEKIMTKAELEEKLKEIEVEKAQLSQANVELESTIAGKDKTAEELQATIDDLTVQLSARTIELDEAAKAKQEECDKYAELQTELQGVNDALAVKTKEAGEAVAKFEQLETESQETLSQLSQYKEKAEKFEKIINGQAPLGGQTEEEDKSKIYTKQERDLEISKYAKEHNISEALAVLQLGKTRPELFKRS